MTNPDATLAEMDLTLGNDPVADLNRLTGADDEPAPVETPQPDVIAPDVEPEAPEVEAHEDELDDEPETPDAPAASPADPFAEMLKAGKPLTYMVDGAKKETPDIVEVEGRGAVIPPEALSRVRDRLQQADRLTDQNRKLYAETQEFSRVGGVEKVAELERNVAKLDAGYAPLFELLDNPDMLAAMLRQRQDGSYMLDPVQHTFLVKQIRLAAQEAEFKARETWDSRRTQHQSQTTEAETRRTLLETQVKSLTEGLPAEDVAEAMAFFGPMANVLYRTVTPEDVAQFPDHNLHVGQQIFDAPRIEAWATGRKNLRAQMSESAVKRTEAVKHNAAVTKQAEKPKPLPPRNKAGEFVKPAAKPVLTRYERMLRARAGQPIFDEE